MPDIHLSVFKNTSISHNGPHARTFLYCRLKFLLLFCISLVSVPCQIYQTPLTAHTCKSFVSDRLVPPVHEELHVQEI